MHTNTEACYVPHGFRTSYFRDFKNFYLSLVSYYVSLLNLQLSQLFLMVNNYTSLENLC